MTMIVNKFIILINFQIQSAIFKKINNIVLLFLLPLIQGIVMFSLKPLLMGLGLAALSSSAFALTTSEQLNYDRLISGDINQVKQAAQSIVSSNNSNPEVLDVLAQYLAKNYLAAADYQLDTMAWACRALGETGNARYRDLLSTIVNSDAHKKIRKYAKKSLKRLPSDSTEQFVVGSVDLSNLQKNAPKSDIPSLKGDDKVLFDIASENLTEIKLLAQQYTSKGLPSKKIGDTLAEYFSQNYKTSEQHKFDTLAWVCKGLATDATGRYKTLIEDAEENSPIRAVRKHCPDDIDGNGPYYKAGDIDLAAVIKQLK